jgi:hypothetical protein
MAETISTLLQIFVAKAARTVEENQCNFAVMKLIKIVSVFSELLLANRRTDTTKLRDHFRINFAERT